MEAFDLEVDSYSREELLNLCDIPHDNSNQSIIKATNTRIIQYNDNPPIKQFFQQIQQKLLKTQQEGFSNLHHGNESPVERDEDEDDHDGHDDNESPVENDMGASQLYKNQHQVGNDKPIPSRDDWKLNVTDKATSSIPIQQQSYLGVSTVKQTPYAQGAINPRVKNMTHRLINIDSQFRNMPDGKAYQYPIPGCTTNYNVTLSETLKNVMSITLSSYEMPYSWAAIDEAKGNNKIVFKISDKYYVSNIPTGNWNLQQLNIHLRITLPALPVSADSKILSVNPNGFIQMTTTDTAVTEILFWGNEYDKAIDSINSVELIKCSSLSNNYQNSLGWLLGFRTESINLATTKHTATATAHSIWSNIYGVIDSSSLTSSARTLSPVQISGLKQNELWFWQITQPMPYCYIVLEDHNKNHNNKGILNIIPSASVLKLPSYANNIGINASGEVCDQSDANIAEDVSGGDINIGRNLTQKQLYTIDSIKRNRTHRSPYSIPTGPVDSDILAKITLPSSVDQTKFGHWINEHGGVLSQNTRAYFGPVDLDRFTIKLLDNHGNQVNLNNRDWSFTLRVEQLYQF